MRLFKFWVLAFALSLATTAPANAVPVAAVAAVFSISSAFVAAAVTVLINAALTFGISSLINAVIGKTSPQRQAAIVTLAIGEQPRTAVFGICAVPGILE